MQRYGFASAPISNGGYMSISLYLTLPTSSIISCRQHCKNLYFNKIINQTGDIIPVLSKYTREVFRHYLAALYSLDLCNFLHLFSCKPRIFCFQLFRPLFITIIHHKLLLMWKKGPKNASTAFSALFVNLRYTFD